MKTLTESSIFMNRTDIMEAIIIQTFRLNITSKMIPERIGYWSDLHVHSWLPQIGALHLLYYCTQSALSWKLCWQKDSKKSYAIAVCSPRATEKQSVSKDKRLLRPHTSGTSVLPWDILQGFIFCLITNIADCTVPEDVTEWKLF